MMFDAEVATYGEDSKESVPPLKHRVETHTARAQGSPAPVPWRWRSCGARIRGHIVRSSEPPQNTLDSCDLDLWPSNLAEVADQTGEMATRPSRAGTGAVAETQAALARRQPKLADAGGLGVWASGHCIRPGQFHKTGSLSQRPSLSEPRPAGKRAVRPEKPRFPLGVRKVLTRMPV
jgi:hypothetical protein